MLFSPLSILDFHSHFPFFSASQFRLLLLLNQNSSRMMNEEDDDEADAVLMDEHIHFLSERRDIQEESFVVVLVCSPACFLLISFIVVSVITLLAVVLFTP